MFAAWWGGREGGTFRPRRGHKPGSRQFNMHQRAELTLGSGNLRDAVSCPAGEDENEWIAMKAIDLFNEVELVYSTVSEFCTNASCPRMCAGRKWEYKWADGKKYPKPTDVSAPQYAEMTGD
jgi:MOB kinase activator 1